jgi:hypothetical protein
MNYAQRGLAIVSRVEHPLPPSQLRQAAFVEPMECLAVAKLPDGHQWLYEIKLL